MKRIKVILFGIGQVGLVAAQQLIDEKYDIVSVYSRDAHLGEDLGSLLGKQPLDIAVSSIDEFNPMTSSADVALFFTTGSPYDLVEAPKQCLEAGINVITVAEGATYAWNYDAALSKEIDEAGKQGNSSLTSTGMTDTYMVHLPAVLASTVPSVRRVAVTTTGNFGRLGACALGELPLGLSPSDFEEMCKAAPPAGTKPPASIGGQCLESMASLMKLTPGEITTTLDVTLADQDIYVATIDRSIERGTISGLLETVTMGTAEGIELAIHLTAEVFAEDTPEIQGITIESTNGETLSLEAGPTLGVEYTAAIAINRIFDIINAAPGYQTIDRLPAPLFRLANR